jgi:hypothetical protein
MLQLGINLVAISVVTVVLFVLFEKPFMDSKWPQKLNAFVRQLFQSGFDFGKRKGFLKGSEVR